MFVLACLRTKERLWCQHNINVKSNSRVNELTTYWSIYTKVQFRIKSTISLNKQNIFVFNANAESTV
jgi:hypothetical protein